MNNFNAIAPIYDQLKSLVFWGRLDDAKRAHLHQIKAGSRVLVLGGGSGQILSYLDDLEMSLAVDFVELSEKMMLIAKGRSFSNIHVNYVLEDVLTLDIEASYDVVIANFIFDLFEIDNLRFLLKKVSNCLSPNGVLLVADFQINKRWHAWFSQLMHGFFHLVASLESRQLKEINSELKMAGFHRTSSSDFYKGFIFSSVFSFNI
ncbi:class I SAM-dependent methyltransferase [Reichenbachiella ulvae]|uniref:Class I SAM-dependent methyltransferase n=1 Tax=Reichenbachiella ulvae TaxID=2980104 RepID=A0ABT3CYA9_9BACT|nr:class I SAM-dependent methyltransferase [Reichenbachiella ulvae]MCV9388683.1 class I SAM-dependent methyltransferase [Reichenbachiella ulvae]